MKTKLYFKQGTRTIFKNKVQLFIIMVLTFIFSFVLTSWLTVSLNFSDSFNTTTSSYKKPNYTYSEKVATSDVTIDKENSQFIPLYDFINSHPQESNQFITFDDGDNNFTGVNFFLVSYGQKERENFITTTFESQQFDNIYKELLEGDFGNAISTVSKKSFFNSAVTYKLADEKFVVDPKMNFTDSKNVYSKFVAKTVYLLCRNFLNDYLNNKNYLAKTNIKIYLDTIGKSAVEDLKNQLLLASDFEIGYNEWIDNANNFNDYGIQSYFYNAMQSLPLAVVNNIVTLFTNSFNDITSSKPNMSLEAFLEEYRNYFLNKNKPSFSFNRGQTSVSENMEIAFEYQFGKKLSGDNFKYKSYENGELDGTSNISYGVKYNGLLNHYESDNKYHGLYGHTNNFYLKSDENNIIGIYYDNNNYIFSGVGINNTYSSSAGGISYDKNQTAYNVRNVFSNRIRHFEIVSDIENDQMSLREEGYSYDPIDKINYRFVVIDDWSDLKIITGEKPNDGSVYISNQYKISNNINKKIKINNYDLNVSGTAVDALTYLQFADIDLPVIDSDQSCIVYLKKDMLRKIFTYKDGNGLSLTMSNNYFFNSGTDGFCNDTYWLNNNMTKDKSIQVKNFNDTNWNLSWKYITVVLKVLKIVGIVSLISIGSIVLFAFWVVIKKCVNENKSQLEFLKAQGVEKKYLSTSYLMYSVLIIFVSFVFGYLLGSIFQFEFAKWFTSYAVLFKSGINFSFVPFLILFIAVSVFVILANYLITYWSLKKSQRHIKINNKLNLSKLNFKIRMQANVSNKGKYELGILSMLVLSSTILMSLFSISISTFKKYIQDSKSTLNYANEYQSSEPLYNSPFSKRVISSWDGLSDSKSIEGNLSKYISTFYNDIDDYESTVNGTSIIPKLIYDTDTKSLKWIWDYIMSNKNYVLDAAKIFINNAVNVNNKSFSIGSFEQFLNYNLHTDHDLMNGYVYDDSNGIDEKRIDKIASFNKLFTDAIPKIFSLIFGGSDIDVSANDWREILLNVARAVLPNSFAKKYVTDERKTQFFFEMNAENYMPQKEDLATVVNAKSGKKSYEITGLQKTQTSYNFKNSTSPFLNLSTIQSLNNLDNDIYNDGFKIYDKESNTLYIPAVVNKNYSAMDKKKLTLSTKGLVLNNTTAIKKNAWAYLNYDESTIDSLKTLNNNDNNAIINSKWLNMDDVDSSKFNYINSVSKSAINKNAEFFSQYVVENNEVKKILRPYYNYNDVFMFVPKSVLNNDISNLLIKGGYDAAKKRRLDITSESEFASVKNNWYGTISNNLVPDFVKASWNIKDDDYFWVAPYNLSYDAAFSDKANGEASISDVLLSNLGTWFDDVLNKKNTVISIQNVDTSTIINGIKNIELVKVGEINSYNRNLIIVDQNLLNMSKGYSPNLTITKPIHSYGEKTRTYKSGNTDVNVYSLKNPTSLTLETKDINQLYNDNYAVSSYFNSKLSKVDEPLNLTAGMAGSLNDNVGIGMLFRDGIESVKSGYTKVDLVSFKLKTISNISLIAISIGIFVITGIIIIAALIIFVLSELFVTRYKKEIQMLKVMGYSSKEIFTIMMVPQIIVFLVSIVVGIVLPLAFVGGIFALFTDYQIIMNTFISPWQLATIGIILVLIFILGNISTVKKTILNKKLV